MTRSRAARPRVRVQSDRNGRALIVDETFASLHRDDGPATGCVWDAIAAPALLLAGRRRPRVLILGLGGGSVARIVRALLPAAEIVGVELDADVVAAAREHFGLEALGVALHVDDALAFLRRDRRRYDMVVDDVFIGHGDDVHKPDWIPHPGLDLARARLREGGLLVSNTIDERPLVEAALLRSFDRVLRIDVEDYDNCVLVAAQDDLDARALRARVAGSPVLAATLPVLRFRSARVSASRRGTAARRR